MIDGFGRTIEYLRVSVTDRCDLRCVYCMPETGTCPMRHSDVLRYEEIARLARIFASLGIRRIRLTGGEPLVRKDVRRLVSMLKEIDGIERVALTTNGTLLSEQLPGLLDAGLDAVNISIDTMDEARFRAITRRSGVERVLKAVSDCAALPQLVTKLNCVPTELNEADLADLASFADEKRLLLRFIELMPIGQGRTLRGLSEAEVLSVLAKRFGRFSLEPETAHEKCRVYRNGSRTVGFISPMSHRFCASCDRVRLTSDGKLKTCLEYPPQLDLRALLSESDETIREAIRAAIAQKPKAHRFGEHAVDSERRGMSEIGG